ncbi:hypothetical protein DPMN_181523 [Dreissena polymorpha]|uniref:Uncharacterized protein n=1 Tax=Dreissena polymorpha TaxID=45954 RepID=A0A9D4I1Q7_DREPO|nr:hypothetical protein DPMN_181523 [Dreissena polymorpha]
MLSSHYTIDVYDAAYSEAHVGMIDFKIDLLKAHVCFKVHVMYDMNVLTVCIHGAYICFKGHVNNDMKNKLNERTTKVFIKDHI